MKPTALLWLLFGLLLLKGLAVAQQPPVSGSKIAGTAIIVLTREFCTQEVKMGNEVFRAGRLLCSSAEEAIRNSFERVIRMETPPKPEDAGGHIVLIPKYADMEATTPLFKNKRNMALLLEWSAIDPSGKILWVQTVEGDAQKKTGNVHQETLKMAEMVVRDLVAKSAEAIKESQEIRHFVETPEK